MFGTKKQEKATQEEVQRQAKESLERTTDLQRSVSAQGQQIQKQQAFLERLGMQQQASLQALDEEVKTLRQHNKEAAAAIHTLKATKVELKTAVVERFQQQLTKTLHAMEGQLQADTRKIERLGEELSSLSAQLKETKTIINQFSALADTVKGADYRLREHAKALDQADQEKLRLMKRIDDLEHMIAKFKRGPRPARR